MIRIRPDQFQTLAAPTEGKFVDALVAHLQRVLPAPLADLGYARAVELIHIGLAKARRYGIHSEQAITLFVDVMVAIHPHFDRLAEFAWSKQILESPDLPDTQKLAIVFSELRRRGLT